MGRIGLILLLSFMQGCAPAASGQSTVAKASSELPPCLPDQLLARVPEPEELEAHRQFELPTIDYPAGTEKRIWGLSVTLRVDENGVPVCHKLSERFGDEVPLDDQRKAFIGELAGWRYTPLTRDGQAVPMIVTETVREQELLEKHVPMPAVPLSQVRIVLTRSGCFGRCPNYSVELRGDGSVLYTGHSFVDVEGEHRYQVPVPEVAALVESARAKDLWSMRPSYRARITDHPTYGLTFDMGGQIHRIEDYVGQLVGIPAVISEFQDEVDKVARTEMWVALSNEGIDHLQQAGFEFDSQEGANLLGRAVANDYGHDDAAMMRLMSLGAPIHGAEPSGWSQVAGRPSLIESALRHRRPDLIEPLVAAGALDNDGGLDQDKIDSAFRAAIEGGNLEAVEKIWNVAGTEPRPSLTFLDEVETPDGKSITRTTPVTLLLSKGYMPNPEWQGLAITRWLVARGCDVKASDADGDTLLHIAAGADEPEFVRYLLDQGLDASAAGQFGLPPLGSAGNEDVALLLLEAGTDLRMMGDGGEQFMDYARGNHWGRVLAWLQEAGVTPSAKKD